MGGILPWIEKQSGSIAVNIKQHPPHPKRDSHTKKGNPWLYHVYCDYLLH